MFVLMPSIRRKEWGDVEIQSTPPFNSPLEGGKDAIADISMNYNAAMQNFVSLRRSCTPPNPLNYHDSPLEGESKGVFDNIS